MQSMSEAALTASGMGLGADLGSGIFFCEKRPQDQSGVDIWEVDVEGLLLLPDDTTEPPDPEDVWWVHHEADVPACRLTLVELDICPRSGP